MPSQLDSWVSNPAETRGPLVNMACWSVFGVATGFLILRLCVRERQGKLWYDDAMLSISWLLLLVQCVLDQLAVNLGYGKHALDVPFTSFEPIAYYGASALSIAITAITLSKMSFGVTLLRLTTGWLRIYVYFAIATLAIFAIPAIVLPWVLCKPFTKTFVDILPGTCISKTPTIRFGRFQAAWAALMDISLALLPWKILWGLQMRTAEKIGVGFAMSLGLVAGIASVLRGFYVEQLAHQDLSYDAYRNTIWAVAETAMTTVATSIPVLRVFFNHALNTVIESYNHSTGRRKSRTTNASSTNTSTLVNVSLRHSGKRTTGGSNNYVELNEVVVDENTGRVIAVTTESLPGRPEHGKAQASKC